MARPEEGEGLTVAPVSTAKGVFGGEKPSGDRVSSTRTSANAGNTVPDPRPTEGAGHVRRLAGYSGYSHVDAT
jgi:hypothetical protein